MLGWICTVVVYADFGLDKSLDQALGCGLIEGFIEYMQGHIECMSLQQAWALTAVGWLAQW